MDSNTHNPQYYADLVSLIDGAFEEWIREENESIDPLEMAAKEEENIDHSCGSIMYNDPESENYVTANFFPNNDTVVEVNLSTIGDIWTLNDNEIRRALNRSEYISEGEYRDNVATVEIPKSYDTHKVVRSLDSLKYAAREGVDNQLALEPTNTR